MTYNVFSGTLNPTQSITGRVVYLMSDQQCQSAEGNFDLLLTIDNFPLKRSKVCELYGLLHCSCMLPRVGPAVVRICFCFCTLHFQARVQTSYKMTKSGFCFMLIWCYNIFRLLYRGYCGLMPSDVVKPCFFSIKWLAGKNSMKWPIFMSVGMLGLNYINQSTWLLHICAVKC